MGKSFEEKAYERPKRRRVQQKKKPYDSRYHPSRESVPQKPKDTHAPKRPMSAYFLFAQEKRNALKTEHSKKKMVDIHKVLAQKWKEADDEEKKQYLEASREAMKAYKELRAQHELTPKYKRYKKQLKEWNEVYREEFVEREYEKKQRRLHNKKKRERKAAKSKTSA